MENKLFPYGAVSHENQSFSQIFFCMIQGSFISSNLKNNVNK